MLFHTMKQEKPIIATTLSGLFIKKEAWDKAHILWYQEAARKLQDDSILEWINRLDYFKGVDEVMQRLHPELTEEERTRAARKTFFDSVIQFIQENPGTKNKEIINYFQELKSRFTLALVTTNTKQALDKILAATGLSELFDLVETSDETEKDDKRAVFERFVKKHGKPVIYIGGDRKDSFDYCKENKIPCIYANLEKAEEIPGVESVHNLSELKKKLDSL